MIAPLLTLLAACSTTSVDGVIVDVSGTPIAGATVRREASECSDITNKQGRFSLKCGAGVWDLSIRHPSYFSQTEKVDVPDGSQVALKQSPLIQIPTTEGLHLLRDGNFMPLLPTTLERSSNSEGEAKRRDFCVDQQGSPNSISSGMLRLLDRTSTPWRMFRMDTAGCAYRDSRNREGRWVVEHRDRTQVRLEPEADGHRIHTVNASVGDYFIAEWSGFFVPTEPKANTYKGYWVQVQD